VLTEAVEELNAGSIDACDRKDNCTESKNNENRLGKDAFESP